MRYLTLEEVLWLHFRVIEDYGGSHGIRDENRLLAVIKAPRQEVFGIEQYPSTHDKAAVYLRNIIGDHPFVDGNKRTAVVVCALFLRQNGALLTATPSELEDFVLRLATNHLSIAAIASWLRTNSS